MDEPTLNYYSVNAHNIVKHYNNISSGIHQFFPSTFIQCTRIIDIGCGSGRDLHELLAQGYDAYGVDPCDEMLLSALDQYPELLGRVEKGGLPELGIPFGGEFDGVLCSAVLMHLPKEELFNAVFAIRRVLKENGRLLISVPEDRPGIDNDHRDDKGRLFNGVRPEYLQLLFERLGFSLIGKWTTGDSLNRPGYSWSTLAFTLKHSESLRPIDQVEGVLSRDRKTATYKLALIRALSEIAIAEYNTARWLSGGTVGIPLGAVAERWLCYYWPLFESATFIPQTRGESPSCAKPVAFRALLSVLIDRYRKRGGLTQFVLDFRSQQLREEDRELTETLLGKIGTTIVSGPVTYAGGSLETGRLFSFDGPTRHILIDSRLWTELSLMGYWIRDAVLLRWAELTADMARRGIVAGDVIDLLLTVPLRERDVGDARETYASLPVKECTWTAETIKKDFDVDHIIPFSLWHNNDLWNLVPVLPAVNNKKRDRLPGHDIMLERRDCLIYYWERLRERHRTRFDMETSRLMGFISPPGNWHEVLFASVAEAIEITAIQKGCERWP
jgi:SAM-dependent methyltransferase